MVERNFVDEEKHTDSYYLNKEQRKGVWPIEGHKTIKLGRGARLLMEITNPLVATAIHRHANFTYDRLERTVLGNTDIIFGTKDAALTRARIVNRAHHLKVEDDAGKSYTANDPSLKGFVFDMRLLAAVAAHENFVGTLSYEQKDSYVLGIKPYGSILGVPERDSPNSWLEVEERYKERLQMGEIQATSKAIDVAHKLIEPLDNVGEALEHLLGPGRLAVVLTLAATKMFTVDRANKLHSVITRGLLPEEIREAYGFDWNSKDEEIFKTFTYGARLANSYLPNGIKYISQFNAKAL